jgi:hypothetical protein
MVKKNQKKQSIASKLFGTTRIPAWVAAISAGLYPMIFYFSANFPLVNSWAHVGYFLAMFIFTPVLVLVLAKLVFGKVLPKWQHLIIPFLNVFIFLFLLKVCLYAGVQKKMIIVIIMIAGLMAFFLHRHLSKWVVLQFLLAILGLTSVVPQIINELNYNGSWTELPDAIEETVLKSTPNIYVIQPDGYVNFSELSKGYYNIENSAFESFVTNEGFKHYPNFNNNYASTLTSNSATFMMKHHYYNGAKNFSEGIRMRTQIVGKNPVLDILKNNGYETTMLAENYYLMLNRPTLGYDHSNIKYDEIPFIGTGLGESKDITQALKNNLPASKKPQFFFIQFLMPSHIAGRASVTKGKEEERTIWAEKLQIANTKLTALITTINAQDPNALVVIMADHGGFVGMEYTEQIYNRTKDAAIVKSIFSSNLLIKWPANKAPVFDTELKSSVNLFRVLFAHLAEDASLLTHLEDNSSYVILKEPSNQGVYKYIDDQGNGVFEKFRK